MTDSEPSPALDEALLNVLADTRLDDHRGMRGPLSGKLSRRVTSLVYRLRKHTRAFGIEGETGRRLRQLPVGRPGQTSRPLTDDEQSFLADLLREVAGRMYPTPGAHVADQITELIDRDSTQSWAKLTRILRWLEHLDVELLEGCTEEDLLPLLSHQKADIRQKAMTVLGRLPEPEPTSDREPDTQAPGGSR